MSQKQSIICNDFSNTLTVSNSDFVATDTRAVVSLTIGDHVIDAEVLNELFTLLDAVKMLDHDSPLKRALIAARTKRRLTDGHTPTG